LTASKSYRLGPSDERDVRWGLSQDVKGDVGIRSSFTAFLNTMNLRSKLERWTPGTPKRDRSGRLDLDNFQSQVIDCKGNDHRTLLTYEMSETVMHAGSDYRRVWGAFEEIGDEHLSTLAIRYGHKPVPGLEAFDDLGVLVAFTKDATRAHQRECRIRRYDPGVIGTARAISHRIRNPDEGDIVDAVSVEVDRDLWSAMFTEANDRLSGACRAYVQAAKHGRSQQRVEFVARRGRAR
jgi:hypothetical protein